MKEVTSGKILLLFLLLFVFPFGIAFAQEASGECQHDPYPQEAQNVTVSCDDPSCNVGPCTNSSSQTEKIGEEVECWHNPTFDVPQSREQNTRVPCDDSTCNDGPCTNRTQTTPVIPSIQPSTATQSPTETGVRGWDPEKKEEIIIKQEERQHPDIPPVTTTQVSDPSDITSIEDLEAFAMSLLADDPNLKLIKLTPASTELEYQTVGRLFGIIPIRPLIKVSLDETGHVKVKFPWYSIFIKKTISLTDTDFSEIESGVSNSTLSKRAQALEKVSDILKAKHEATRSP